MLVCLLLASVLWNLGLKLLWVLDLRRHGGIHGSSSVRTSPDLRVSETIVLIRIEAVSGVESRHRLHLVDFTLRLWPLVLHIVPSCIHAIVFIRVSEVLIFLEIIRHLLVIVILAALHCVLK